MDKKEEIKISKREIEEIKRASKFFSNILLSLAYGYPIEKIKEITGEEW